MDSPIPTKVSPTIPTKASPVIPALPPVIPAKAGIHNSAPIMKQPTLYIMGNKPKGTLYTNVTSNRKTGCGNIGLGSLAIQASRLTNIGNGSLQGVGYAPLCPTYEACVVFNGFPPAQASPVIPAKAGIHNSAPIMKQPTLYIMGNKAKGTLYTGVTSNLKNRMWGLGLGSLAIQTSRLTNIGNGSIQGVGYAPLCPTYEAKVE